MVIAVAYATTKRLKRKKFLREARVTCELSLLAPSFSSPVQAKITSGDGKAQDVGNADGGGNVY